MLLGRTEGLGRAVLQPRLSPPCPLAPIHLPTSGPLGLVAGRWLPSHHCGFPGPGLEPPCQAGRRDGGPPAGVLAGREGWARSPVPSPRPPGTLWVLLGLCPGADKEGDQGGEGRGGADWLGRAPSAEDARPQGHRVRGTDCRAGKGMPPGVVAPQDGLLCPGPRLSPRIKLRKGGPLKSVGPTTPEAARPCQEAPARPNMFTRVSSSTHRATVSCQSLYLTSQHRGRTQQHQEDGLCREGRTRDRYNAEMALPLRGARPHGHHRDSSQPQAETQVQDHRRHPSPGSVGLTVCPVQGLGPRAARRSRRGVGAASSQRGPRLGAPMPMGRSHTHFIHRRRRPTRTQISAKRGKRSRITGLRWSCPRAPGWTHERSMGSSQEEGLLCQLSRLNQDADLDATDTTRPRAVLLEKHLLEGEKRPPSPGQGPFFYIGGTNGASIISSYCKSKGWQRTQDSRREDYKLKWCEVKSRDTYCSFREGEQLLYQLPNNRLLTTKIGLLSALREYSRVLSKTNAVLCTQARSGKDAAPALEEPMWTSPGCLGPQRVLKMEEFFPETYRLDIRDERKAFFTLFDDTQMWICKPTASNQGKGIFLLRNQEEVAAFQAKTQSMEDDPIYDKMSFRVPQARIVQRYIQNPLLLDGKKFDVRSYLLIACTTPYMVFFGHGYARLTLSLYDPHASDLGGHLTNQFMQKKSPLYVMLKEDTVWSMDHLNRYINDKFRKTKGLPRDWVFTTFTKRMQQIMAHCFLAVKSKLQCKLGYFDLIGCDFLIDENFKVWLLEMNSNPALHTNCEVLKEVIPGVVMETLDLATLLQPYNPRDAYVLAL
nr:PREDICTED: inactive polyglycylase TTLL10 [Equus przewalskii]